MRVLEVFGHRITVILRWFRWDDGGDRSCIYMITAQIWSFLCYWDWIIFRVLYLHIQHTYTGPHSQYERIQLY